jgi:hypothetical protein
MVSQPASESRLKPEAIISGQSQAEGRLSVLFHNEAS